MLHNPDRQTSAIKSIAPLGKGLRLHVNTDSWLEWNVFFFATYEPQVASLLRDLIPSGETAIDVGANIGIHTLVMARSTGVGLVVACEPNPAVRERLRENLALNQISNVCVRPEAITSEIGKVRLHLPVAGSANQASASLAKHQDQRALVDGTAIDVASTTLDHIAKEEGLRKVALIKVDVEGFEGGVLAGAHKLLLRDHPALIFEYHPAFWQDAGHNLDGVLQQLGEVGYRYFFEITPTGPRPLPAARAGTMNVLALASELSRPGS
jgi:FkbM family methyltransferase